MALTTLQADEVLDAAVLAFSKAILPIRVFSTAFRKNNIPMALGDKMRVPYYPAVTAASTNFNGTYDFTGAGPDATGVEVNVNKRKYQPIITSSQELARNNFSPAAIGAQKGAKLGLDVVTDVLSAVTLANFGAAAFTGAANTFDADDVADIQQICDEASWPMEMRSLVIKAAYRTALVKDNSIQAAYAYGNSNPIQEGWADRVHGFNVVANNEIPANAQNLVGFAAHPSAIAIGFSPITPADAVLNSLIEYRVVEDPDTGIIVEYRAWADPNTDSLKEVIEVNYGFAVVNAAGLKRLVSA